MTLQGLRLLDFVGRRDATEAQGVVSVARRRGGGARVSRASSSATCAGPSALGGGWRRALELLYLIAVTEFKRHYLGTALGYLWSLARPLMLFGVLLAVFTQVFRLGSEVPHYPVLLLFNIVLFGFFQEATGIAVRSIVGAGGGRAQDAVPAPGDPARGRADRAVQPRARTSSWCSSSSSPSASTPMWTWLLFPLLLVALIVLTTAVSMIVPSLYPRFRDLAIIWTRALDRAVLRDARCSTRSRWSPARCAT